MADTEFSKVVQCVKDQLARRASEATNQFFDASGQRATDTARRALASMCMVAVARGLLEQLARGRAEWIAGAASEGREAERRIATVIGVLEKSRPHEARARVDQSITDTLQEWGMRISGHAERCSELEQSLRKLLIDLAVMSLGAIAHSYDDARTQDALNVLITHLLKLDPIFGKILGAKDAVEKIGRRDREQVSKAASFELENKALSEACVAWAVAVRCMIQVFQREKADPEEAREYVTGRVSQVLKKIREALPR